MLDSIHTVSTATTTTVRGFDAVSGVSQKSSADTLSELPAGDSGISVIPGMDLPGALNKGALFSTVSTRDRYYEVLKASDTILDGAGRLALLFSLMKAMGYSEAALMKKKAADDARDAAATRELATFLNDGVSLVGAATSVGAGIAGGVHGLKAVAKESKIADIRSEAADRLEKGVPIGGKAEAEKWSGATFEDIAQGKVNSLFDANPRASAPKSSPDYDDTRLIPPTENVLVPTRSEAQVATASGESNSLSPGDSELRSAAAGNAASKAKDAPTPGTKPTMKTHGYDKTGMTKQNHSDIDQHTLGKERVTVISTTLANTSISASAVGSSLGAIVAAPVSFQAESKEADKLEKESLAAQMEAVAEQWNGAEQSMSRLQDSVLQMAEANMRNGTDLGMRIFS